MHGIDIIKRGYENFEKKLTGLGADISDLPPAAGPIPAAASGLPSGRFRPGPGGRLTLKRAYRLLRSSLLSVTSVPWIWT